RPFSGCAGQPPTVRTERHVASGFGIRGKRVFFLSGLGVPHLYVRPAGAGQAAAVGAKRHAFDAAMREFEPFSSGLGVPHPHCLLVRAAGGALAVRAEGQTEIWAVDSPTVSLETHEFSTGLRVPALHGPVLSAAGQPPAVRTEGHTQDGV